MKDLMIKTSTISGTRVRDKKQFSTIIMSKSWDPLSTSITTFNVFLKRDYLTTQIDQKRKNQLSY